MVKETTAKKAGGDSTDQLLQAALVKSLSEQPKSSNTDSSAALVDGLTKMAAPLMEQYARQMAIKSYKELVQMGMPAQAAMALSFGEQLGGLGALAGVGAGVPQSGLGAPLTGLGTPGGSGAGMGMFGAQNGHGSVGRAATARGQGGGYTDSLGGAAAAGSGGLRVGLDNGGAAARAGELGRCLGVLVVKEYAGHRKEH